MSRLTANRAIIAILAVEVERHPEWRFHQLLQNFNVERPGEDLFYEESDTTFKLLDAQNLGIDPLPVPVDGSQDLTKTS